MTTLDDKLLGEKLHYYCSSSSESDGEDESDKEDVMGDAVSDNLEVPESNNCRNTGPKGVIDDWQKYNKLKSDKKKRYEKERLDVIKKLCITCDSSENEISGNGNNDDLTDNFLQEYRKKRMLEMLSQMEQNVSFGTVIDLKSSEEFLNAIDQENKFVTVIVHIYDNYISLCKNVNNILDTLALEYKSVKFCKILVTTVGLSLNFKLSGLPAFLIYKDKQLIGNFVRITDELGDEFYEGDIENFLIEHGIIENKMYIPSIVNSNSDSE